MTRRNSILMLLAALLFSSPAIAQDTLLEYTYMACKDNIETFCDQVTPGEGRLLHCLAAHEDKISYDCEYALYTAASIIEDLAIAIVEEFTDAVEYLGTECATDIGEHCEGIPAGEGRILMCLDQNEADLDESCTTAINNVFGG